MGPPHVGEKKKNLDGNLSPYTKINLKWFIDANIKHKGIKLTEEKIGKKSACPNVRNDAKSIT